MNSRVLRILVSADVMGLQAGMAKAQHSVSEFDKAVQRSAEKRQAINQIGSAFGLVGVAATAASAVAIKSFADFDSAMSAVKATGEDAANSIDKLRQAALDAGAETAYSATESAAAIENLAKAGISAADILGGGLDGALALAAAGGIDVASAAEYAAIAMTQFGLSGAEVPHVADLLAAAAGKANGEVSDLGQALSQSGLVAGQMGLSIEETTGVLAAFAQAGLLGSDAGTSFKAMLQRLANPAEETKTLLKELGIEAYDAGGNLVSMADLAGQLQEAFEGQSQATRDAAMAQIFGSDAVRAASVLYANGADGINKWTEQVNDAGYAADTASTRMDNLKGDIELLMGSLETAMIGTGAGANGPLRTAVQDLTSLVDAYGTLPGPVQESTLRMLGLTAAIGGSVFVGTRAVTGFANLANTLAGLDEQTGKFSRTQLALRGSAAVAGLALTSYAGSVKDSNEELGTLMQILGPTAMGAAFGPWGAAVGAAGGVMSAFAGQSAEAAAAQRELQAAAASVAATLDQQTGALTESTRASIRKTLAESGALKEAGQIGANSGDLLLAAEGDAAALERVTTAARDYWAETKAASDDFGKRAEALADIGQVLAPLGTTIDAITDKRSAIESANDALYDSAGAFGNVALRLAGAAGGVDQYASALDKVPEDVRTRILAEGANASLEDIQILAAAYEMTPEEVLTILSAQDFASPVIMTAQSLLDQLGLSTASPVASLLDYASGPLSGVLASVTNLDGRTAAPDAILNDGASSQIDYISGKIWNLNGASATVHVNAVVSRTLSGIPGARGLLGGLLAEANGGILNFAQGGIIAPAESWRHVAPITATNYANGGIRRENHVAQIAPAGSWRIWAEDETPGEAWIPPIKETA